MCSSVCLEGSTGQAEGAHQGRPCQPGTRAPSGGDHAWAARASSDVRSDCGYEPGPRGSGAARTPSSPNPITPTSPGSESSRSNPDPRSLPARASQQFKELRSAGSFHIDWFLETHKKSNTRKEGISESHPLGWQPGLGSFKY